MNSTIAAPTRRPFLRANWANLAIVSYAVAPEQVHDLVPPHCTLDLRDGQAFVSLVAFDFLGTQVRGVAWPGYRNFPEINLRMYVRHGADRGVCFIREYVPQRLVARMARFFYNEPYRRARMISQTQETPTSITIRHELILPTSTSTLSITGEKPAIHTDPAGIEHFFKEHEWGFGKTHRGELLRFRVEHPTWDIWPVRSFELHWDWAAAYGARWQFLQGKSPYSVVFARGSEVRVFPGEGIIP
ncbi:MAG: DUF2071 domain-containing protein [Tepidisphaeraceae bacterium]|jgi:uncharacterized protein YqjF (DUF2071 family)